MKNIEENDTFLLWRHYTLSNTDRKVLAMLYLPLIGFESFGMYSFFDSLLGEKEYYQGPLNNLKKNLNIDGFHFILAREKLEAIGLLKTYKKNINDKDEYVFDLQQPKDPKQFFSDVLLVGNLEKACGELELRKLKMIFGLTKKIDSSFQNVSAKFEDYFSVQDELFFKETENKSYQTRENMKDSYFSLEEFKRIFAEKEPFGNADNIDENTIKILAETADLYHLSMDNLVDKYLDSISSRGVFVEKAFIKSVRSSIDKTLKKEVNQEEDKYIKYLGDTVVSKKLEAFSHYSPIEVLFHLTHVKPQLDDYNLIEELEKDYELIPSVISVVIDFTLASTNGVFAKNYAKKIARTLVYNQAGKDSYLAYMVLFKQVQNMKNKQNDKTVPLQNIDTSLKQKEKNIFAENNQEETSLPEISEDDLVF